MSGFAKGKKEDATARDSAEGRPTEDEPPEVGGHDYAEDHPYVGLLDDANKEAFDDLERSQCIVTGMTSKGVPVLVFIPRLGFEKLNCVSQEDKDRALKRMLLLFIKSADEIVQRGYILVFAYTALSILSQIPLVYKYYKMLPRSYKKNVRKLIVLHPAYLIRSFFEVGVRWFVKSKFYRKLFFMDSVVEVQEILDPFDTHLPAGLLRYDEADRGDGDTASVGSGSGDSSSGSVTQSAPLDTLYEPELGTTDFLHRCSRYLSSGGRLESQGIFRITGDGDAIEVVRSRLTATQSNPMAMKSVIFPTDDEREEGAPSLPKEKDDDARVGGEAPSAGKLGVLIVTDVNTAASALKAALRYLPIPVVTYEARIALASATAKLAGGEAGSGAWDEEMDRILMRMPSTHRNTLQEVLSLLVEVAHKEGANSMSAANLGKIFAPSLMRSQESGSSDEDASMAFAEIAISSKVLTRLITKQMTKQMTK